MTKPTNQNTPPSHLNQIPSGENNLYILCSKSKQKHKTQPMNITIFFHVPHYSNLGRSLNKLILRRPRFVKSLHLHITPPRDST